MEPAPAPQPTRNLLLLHTPHFQDRADWEAVKAKIDARAPDIEVRIDDNLQPSPETSQWQTTRPSLVFSPFALVGYRPRGGAVFAGKHMGKGAEWLRLQQSGLPVPPTLRLVPGLTLDRDVWGDYVIVKPGLGTLGRGVRLLRTDEVGQHFAELTEDGKLRIFVQRFIDHVDGDGHPCAWRVLTMFGEPLTQVEHRWTEPRRSLAEIAADPLGRIASNAVDVKRKSRLVKVPEVLELARRVAAAFPRIPCLGQDIIRQTGTGTLWILETNPGGYTWHLSSPHSRAAGFDPDHVSARYAQFNALEVAAETLIAKTRTAAV